MRRKIAPLALALAVLLTGCTSAGISSDPAPSSTPVAEAVQPSAEPSTPAPIEPAAVSQEKLAKLPWVSTFTVYSRADVPVEPGTPYRNAVASLPKGADFAIAYTKPGGPAFALIGEKELSDKTALPVISRQAGWVLVLIPGRLNLPGDGPVNGAAAWVPESQVSLREQSTQVVVDLGAGEVRVLESLEEVASYPITLDGNDLTPAMGVRGFAVSSYFTQEGRACSSQKSIALSTQSEEYKSFVDGASLIAIHSWSESCRARSAQTTRTSGCINISDTDMADLLKRVKPGTPITFKGGENS